MMDSAAQTQGGPLGPCGALILDGRGVIVRCSDAAVRIFGGDSAAMEGGSISAFVAGLMSTDTSPSFNARHADYLSKCGLWRRFQAIDVHGRRFPVDIAMSRMAAEGQHFLLLNLRLPAATN